MIRSRVNTGFKEILLNKPWSIAKGRDYSETTAARLDQDVQRLLAEQHEIVSRLLSRVREKLDYLVEALLREETVNQEELIQLLGPRPQPTENLIKAGIAQEADIFSIGAETWIQSSIMIW